MDHRTVAYKSQAFADVPAAQCSPQTIVGGTMYSVVCPACHGHFAVEDANGSFRVGIFRKRPPEPSAAIPVVCECGLDHAGRDPDAPFPGCGAAWRLTP